MQRIWQSASRKRQKNPRALYDVKVVVSAALREFLFPVQTRPRRRIWRFFKQTSVIAMWLGFTMFRCTVDGVISLVSSRTLWDRLALDSQHIIWVPVWSLSWNPMDFNTNCWRCPPTRSQIFQQQIISQIDCSDVCYDLYMSSSCNDPFVLFSMSNPFDLTVACGEYVIWMKWSWFRFDIFNVEYTSDWQCAPDRHRP